MISSNTSTAVFAGEYVSIETNRTGVLLLAFGNDYIVCIIFMK